MPLPDPAIRVLGALLEKARTTPDAYPLSMQALVAACNQKTAREPVTAYAQREVEEAMQLLRDRGLAATVRRTGDRVPKHRHRLRDALDLSDAEEAILALLMLRGPQTSGELRTRSERYGGIPDVATAEATLAAMAERRPPLVENRGRRPGQSQDRWMHTLGASEEDRRPRSRVPSAGEEAGADAGRTAPSDGRAAGASDDPSDGPGDTHDLSELHRRIERLEARVARLEAEER